MGVLAKRKILVLIGPDCSGKSTLAARLAHYYELPIAKGLRIADRQGLVRGILDQLAVWKHPITEDPGMLLDRWQFPCDIVYERVHERPESPLAPILPQLVDLARSAGVLFIHVSASPDALGSRLESRGDDEVTYQKIIHARQEYIDLFRQADFPAVHLNTSLKTPEESFRRAVNLIDGYYVNLNRESVK